MYLSHIQNQVFEQPWLITPEAHQSIVDVVQSKLFERHLSGSGSHAPEDFKALDFSSFLPERPEARMDDNRIAHVPLQGTMMPRASSIERSCGTCDTSQLRNQIADFTSQGAKGFMFEVNSPGGAVLGTPELAQDIANISVPTVSYCEGMECSGAIYALAGVDQKFASKSSLIGSIGVFMPRYDRSKQMEAAGIKYDPIVSEKSDLKAIDTRGALSEVHRNHLQAQVDSMNEEFRGWVTSHRPNVSDDTMRGQSFVAAEAVERELVDYISSYVDAYDSLLGASK